MWSAVAPEDPQGAVPSARAKHSATIVGDCVYVLGGRNGNLPLKDFWRYNLVSGKWQQLKPVGERLPSLQEHTAVAYKDNIYVFGGEVSFSASTETPLWVYDLRHNSWRKVKTKKGVTTPKGRRGHTALVHNGSMLIYGGYQDLKGSSGELWAFHFETESWHLVSSPPSKTTDHFPPPRHKHSAAIHEESMWIYGGMTDLHERSDLWKFDFYAKSWTCIKTKVNPGPLHSHACCKMPSSMILFGGDRNGQSSNDLWKFNFDMEAWEKIVINGVKPQPRSESKALIVSELMLKGATKHLSLEARSLRIRARTCNSVDRGNRHSSYLPNNRVAPSENTYVFQPSQFNYTDGSTLAQQYGDTRSSKTSFLQEISKLSQINISRISNKCNYTVLSRGQTTDSTESLLRQHSSPQQEINTTLAEELPVTTPSRGSMVKSKSAHVIKKQYPDTSPTSEEDEEEAEARKKTRKKRVEFDNNIKKIPREPISVPNFSVLTLPTPVLTPVEASKLVYLTDEETDVEVKASNAKQTVVAATSETDDEYDQLKPLKRVDSYSSHLGYTDNPLYQEMLEKCEENASSTSDYYSIETVNRLSSASSYSMKTTTPQEDTKPKDPPQKEGPFGFCNPNYFGPPTTKSMLTHEEKKMFSRALTADSPEHRSRDEEEILELMSYDGILDKNTKVIYRHSSRCDRPANLPLHKTQHRKPPEHRAQSAGRVERRGKPEKPAPLKEQPEPSDPFIPLYIYIIGGKEQGHVTVFQRPISIWRLKLF